LGTRSSGVDEALPGRYNLAAERLVNVGGPGADVFFELYWCVDTVLLLYLHGMRVGVVGGVTSRSAG
jgi:hypothetical protein